MDELLRNLRRKIFAGHASSAEVMRYIAILERSQDISTLEGCKTTTWLVAAEYNFEHLSDHFAEVAINEVESLKRAAQWFITAAHFWVFNDYEEPLEAIRHMVNEYYKGNYIDVPEIWNDWHLKATGSSSSKPASIFYLSKLCWLDNPLPFRLVKHWGCGQDTHEHPDHMPETRRCFTERERITFPADGIISELFVNEISEPAWIWMVIPNEAHRSILP